MVTFSADITPYSLDAFTGHDGGLGWQLNASRCAVLVHDLLPYYLGVLDEGLQHDVVEAAGAVVQAADAGGVPVLASAPRAATVIEQRGVGGRLWGLGPSAVAAATPALERLVNDDIVWVRKRSLSAFFATDLDVELRRRGRDQLVIVGVFASAGILATTFDALARDVEVFVVGDAVADYSPHLHETTLAQVARSTGQVVNRRGVEMAFRR